MIGARYDHAWDMNTIKMNYKFLARWYLTPVRIQKYQPDSSPCCWRNCGGRATMTHIWWECPKIKKYWLEIVDLINQITEEKIDYNMLTCLFHISKTPRKQYTKTIIPKFLNAAKGLIPKRWLGSEGPDIRDGSNKWITIAKWNFLGAETKTKSKNLITSGVHGINSKPQTNTGGRC